MGGELAAVVERDGLAQLRRHRGEQADEVPRHTLGGSVAWSGGQHDPCSPLENGQRGLTVSGKEDRVGFPMTRPRAVGSG